MMRNVIENKKKETPFQMFFLKNDKNQSVKVAEVNEIDFEEVKSRLERGKSVYITRKQEKKTDINFIAYELVKDHGTFFVAKRG